MEVAARVRSSRQRSRPGPQPSADKPRFLRCSLFRSQTARRMFLCQIAEHRFAGLLSRFECLERRPDNFDGASVAVKRAPRPDKSRSTMKPGAAAAHITNHERKAATRCVPDLQFSNGIVTRLNCTTHLASAPACKVYSLIPLGLPEHHGELWSPRTDGSNAISVLRRLIKVTPKRISSAGRPFS